MLYRRHFPLTITDRPPPTFIFLFHAHEREGKVKFVFRSLACLTRHQKAGALVLLSIPSSLGENRFLSRWALTKGPKAWETNLMFAFIKQGVRSSPLPAAWSKPHTLPHSEKGNASHWSILGSSWVGGLCSLELGFFLQTLPGNNWRRSPGPAVGIGPCLGPTLSGLAQETEALGLQKPSKVPTVV